MHPQATDPPPTFLVLMLWALLGSVALYVLNRLHSRQPFSVMTAINVKITVDTHPGLVILDILVSSAIGSAIVVGIATPATVAQALTAGLGMTGLFSAFAKEVRHG